MQSIIVTLLGLICLSSIQDQAQHLPVCCNTTASYDTCLHIAFTTILAIASAIEADQQIAAMQQRS